MNKQTQWTTAFYILLVLNTLAFIPSFFFILQLFIGSPQKTLSFITLPLLIFTTSTFALNFAAAAWQMYYRRTAALWLCIAGGLLVICSAILLVSGLSH